MRTTALKAVTEHSGPVILGAGMTLLAVSLVTSATHNGITATPPNQATSAPVTAPPSTSPAKPTRPRATRTAPRTEPTAGGQVVAASEPRASSSSERPSGIAPSGPAPKPPAATRQPATRCDIGVTALTINACVNLGGTR